MKCPQCCEELYNTYECDNCGYNCEDDLQSKNNITDADIHMLSFLTDANTYE